MNTKNVKEKMRYCKVPATEQWRLNVIDEHLKDRARELEISELENPEIEAMLEYLCTS